MLKYLSLFLLTITSVFGLGEFVARCPATHNAPDDPVVFPGSPGLSHMHTFFGADGVTAFSTVDEMIRLPTTCGTKHDHSAYWVPTLMHLVAQNGGSDPNTCNPMVNMTSTEYIQPDRATFYYHTFDNHALVQPIPLGLVMIAKNHYKFSCQGGGPSGEDLVDCGSNPLELLINFQDCWDGQHLDSLDHMSHVAFSVGNKCPISHPVQIPRLQFKLRYPVNGGSDYMLSSGPASTAHADFVNGWVPEIMQQRVEECSRKDKKCDEVMDFDATIPTEIST